MTLNGTKRFGVHLDATLKVIKQDLSRRFKEAGIDLTPEQWAILAELNECGMLAQKELAQSTFKDAPTVSRIVDLLVKRKLINRQPDSVDRRKFLVSLTSEGQEIFTQSAPLVHAARTIAWEGLSDEDYQQLKNILTKVADNIQSK